MSVLDNDLAGLNFQFLVLVRECARNRPMEAIWKFNLNAEEVDKISGMSIDELKSVADCSRAIFTLAPLAETSLDVTPSILAALISLDGN